MIDAYIIADILRREREREEREQPRVHIDAPPPPEFERELDRPEEPSLRGVVIIDLL